MPERHTSGRAAWDYNHRSDFIKPNGSVNRRPIAAEVQTAEKVEVEQSVVADFAAEDFRARWWPMKESPRRGN